LAELTLSIRVKIKFNATFHPQADGQSERTIQTLEDMLRACVLEFKYNNIFQASIDMAPYEALYGRKCRSPLYWDEVGELQLIKPEIVQDTHEKIALIRERLASTQSRQKKLCG